MNGAIPNYFEFSIKARGLLENSFDLEPKIPPVGNFRSMPRVQLWDYGCGWEGIPHTLTVCEPWTPETSNQRIVREAVWLRQEDLNSTVEQSDVNPTISIRDANVQGKEFDTFIERLSKLSISIMRPYNEESITCDADVYGFAYYSCDDPPTILRIVWSDYYPDDWRVLIEIVGDLRAYLLRILDENA